MAIARCDRACGEQEQDSSGGLGVAVTHINVGMWEATL